MAASKKEGKLAKSQAGLLMPEKKIRHIAVVERLGIFCQGDIAVLRGGNSSDAGARAPEECFLLFGGAALDVGLALRIAGSACGLVVAF